MFRSKNDSPFSTLDQVAKWYVPAGGLLGRSFYCRESFTQFSFLFSLRKYFHEKEQI